MTCSHYIRGLNNVEEVEECGRQQDEDTMPVDFFCQVIMMILATAMVMMMLMMMMMMVVVEEECGR